MRSSGAPPTVGRSVVQNTGTSLSPVLAEEQSIRRGFAPGWRRAAAQPDAADLVTSGLFSAQIWAEASFWRPAALWAGIAGVLSVGATVTTVNWQTLALALLLVDTLWGSLWRLAGGRAQSLALPPGSLRRRVWLPYLQPGSPAARIFSGDHQDVWPLAFRTALPAMALALLAAAVLGMEAILLTCAVIVIAVAGWTARHAFGGIPALLAGVVSIGLPWLLLMRQMAPAGVEIEWLAPMTLLSCWVLHYWGEMLILVDSRAVKAMALMGIAEIGVMTLLIVVQAPLWLAGVALFFLPAWLTIARGAQVGKRMQPLWLLALLLSALALGQVI